MNQNLNQLKNFLLKKLEKSIDKTIHAIKNNQYNMENKYQHLQNILNEELQNIDFDKKQSMNLIS
jgi:hypothetical protein